MDLVMMIDTSGSMSGTKIKLVKETLLFLVEVLKEKDRISLIEFNSSSEILLPLTNINKENKEKINKIIKDIYPRGNTNIQSALDNAFKVLE